MSAVSAVVVDDNDEVDIPDPRLIDELADADSLSYQVLGCVKVQEKV